MSDSDVSSLSEYQAVALAAQFAQQAAHYALPADASRRALDSGHSPLEDAIHAATAYAMGHRSFGAKRINAKSVRMTRDRVRAYSDKLSHRFYADPRPNISERAPRALGHHYASRAAYFAADSVLQSLRHAAVF